MATLHVRNVPETVYTKIRSLARAEGRSMNAQVIRLLTVTSRGATATLSVEEAIQAARRLRQAQKGRRGPSGLSLLHEVRRARERG